ncbi:hypothetical protein Gorai_017401 [Gossypium raimondii]|uniref:RNase H type-1 domain-containing protein n=1 Tax=Gossypium raimondii TaxID=29730 RepID=A0A7J8PBT8_GOSRA|nr:hypothetical protein [Gossypium raimondii]
MLEGLKLAWSRSFQKVEIKSDNALLIDTLHNGLAAVNNIVEVRMIHEWFYKGWEVKCRLILRDIATRLLIA